MVLEAVFSGDIGGNLKSRIEAFLNQWDEFIHCRVPQSEDRKSTRLNSSHQCLSRMPSSA